MESPRYVYMASIPMAIMLGILATNLVAMAQRRYLKLATVGVVVALISVVAIVGSVTTIKRNESFQDGAAPYQVLGTRLRAALPSVPSGSRIVIHNCSLQLFWIWPQVTVEAEYRDPTLKVVNVPPQVAPPPARPGDIDVYYLPASETFSMAPPGNAR